MSKAPDSRLSELIAFRTPIILASGPLGRSARSIRKFASTAGGIVTKSATWLPEEGNPPPRVARVGERGLINWEGLPNPGYRVLAEAVRMLKAEGMPCPIITSIGPLRSPEEQRDIAVAFEEAGADAVELDFKWGAHFESGLLSRVVGAVKRAVSIPVIVKLAPFVGDITENGRVAEDAGADAITAVNSVFPAMQINCQRQSPTLSAGFGGLSGRPILPLAVAAIYQLYQTVHIPLMGSGGVTTGEDALQMILAGAQAVQICTAAMLEGPTVFKRIHRELEALVVTLGLGSVEASVGLAHRGTLHEVKA